MCFESQLGLFPPFSASLLMGFVFLLLLSFFVELTSLKFSNTIFDDLSITLKLQRTGTDVMIFFHQKSEKMVFVSKS
jgi:hypothetical protein